MNKDSYSETMNKDSCINGADTTIWQNNNMDAYTRPQPKQQTNKENTVGSQGALSYYSTINS